MRSWMSVHLVLKADKMSERLAVEVVSHDLIAASIHDEYDFGVS